MARLINLGTINRINLRSTVLLIAATVSVLTVLLVGGILNPRGFGLAVAIVMAVSAIALYGLLRSFARPRDPNAIQHRSAKKSAKGLYFRVAIILGLLVVSALATRGGPFLPRLIGASILILFLVGSILGRWPRSR